jgi:glycosyltransferase involved in cell wall biosynthesis
MFTAVKSMAPVAYADPWPETFADRITQLGRGHFRIAYFYEKPDTSTFRYRVWNMIESLSSRANDVSAAWFCRADIPLMDRFIERADVLVICRSRYDHDIARLLARARARGLRLVFDVDDLVFDTRHAHVIMDTLDQDTISAASWDHWFAYLGRHGAVLRLCDAAIVTNDYLAARAQEFAPGIPTHVVPNFLNRAQITLSEKIFLRKQATGFAGDGRIHLGYFSGTPTHNHDFKVIGGALAALLDSDPRLAVIVVGFLKLPGPMLRHSDRITFLPLQDFLNLQIRIGGTELNLVPLQNNIFTNCKSDLKYFEAAITGTVSVATPTFAFSQSIRDGENGFLARAQDWSAALQRALASPDRYAQIATDAYDDARRNHTPEANIDRILSAVRPAA